MRSLHDHRPWAIRVEARTMLTKLGRGELTAETRGRASEIFGEPPSRDALRVAIEGQPEDAHVDLIAEAIAAAEARSRELMVAPGGVAVIPLQGLIVPFPGLLSLLFGGGGGLQGFQQQLHEALTNDEVQSILIDVDSPGGVVDLVPETAALLRDADKPTVAIANTDACSAAYWIASQADKLVVTPSGNVGSIGVFSIHDDWSGFNERVGVLPEYIFAGEFKIEGNPDEPLSKEGRVAWQERVNEVYDMFIADVATGRGTSEDAVRNGYGKARALLARPALAEGLVDEIDTFEQELADLADNPPAVRAAADAGWSAHLTDDHAAETRTLPVADDEPEARCVELVRAEVRAEGEGPTVSGYAAVFETASDNLGGFTEEIKRGAFKRVLKGGPDVRFLIDHRGVPLARTTNGTLRLSEDPKGLRFEADLPDTQQARDLATSIERGDIDQMSFRFRVQEDGRDWHFPEDRAELPRRTIREVSELLDVSACTFPAYAATEIELRELPAAMVSSLFERACERAQAGEVSGDLHELDLLDQAAEQLDTVTPWQREHALRATGDEPEGEGAAASTPGEPIRDAETEAGPFGLAVRRRRLSLLEQGLGS